MKFLFLMAVLSLASSAEAKIVGKSVTYKDKDAVLSGYVAYDDAKKGLVPGILVVHDWTGEGEYVQERAQMLAKMGYVAFAADIYGKGIRAPQGPEAAKLAGIYKNDRPLMRKRAFAGLDELKKQPHVDANRLAAIGYCFGGTVVLELARAGADLRGVASFHGGLSTPMPAEAGKVKAKVVAFHGAEDPNVPPEEVNAFEDEMRKAKVDWSLTKYANAVHSFTNPHMVGKEATPGSSEYNAAADHRSWAALQDSFREWFN
ncbi:MAG: dienelactone hydrolase family protein [Bdellovibrionota bacterium]